MDEHLISDDGLDARSLEVRHRLSDLLAHGATGPSLCQKLVSKIRPSSAVRRQTTARSSLADPRVWCASEAAKQSASPLGLVSTSLAFRHADGGPRHDARWRDHSVQRSPRAALRRGQLERYDRRSDRPRACAKHQPT